jgi:hypothetical protein
MAFHPFHTFRKHQKSLLAILTILCMFIFILTGFSGSIVDRIGYLFGRGNKDKTPVTTLFGDKVTVGDVQQLQMRRRMVDQLMSALAAQSQYNLLRENPLDATEQKQLQELPLKAIQEGGGLESVSRAYRTFQAQLLKDGRVDQARFVGRTLLATLYPVWRSNNGGSFYFGGNASVDNLLDFKIWQHQADHLDINLTDDDVVRALNREFDADQLLTGDPAKDLVKLRDLARFTGSTNALFAGTVQPKEVYDALRDEFRVRMAQEAFLGSAPGARGALGTGLASDQTPAGSTPDQFWQFFRDNQTKLSVALLKLPVSQFIGQVKGTPGDRELQELYRNFKDAEPNPDLERPGFKVPRRVKVAWVSADSSAPYYRERSKDLLPLLSGAQALTLLTAPQPIPAGAVTLAGPAALASIQKLPLQAEYDAFVWGVSRFGGPPEGGIGSWWNQGNPLGRSEPAKWDTTTDLLHPIPQGNNLYAVGLHRPDTAASVLGQLLASVATKAPGWSAALTLQGATTERRAGQADRVASLVLAGSNPSLFGALAQGAALVTVPVPPLTAVRDVLEERLRDRVVEHDLVPTALTTFVQGLEAKRFDPKEAEAFIKANATPEHGITAFAVMAEPRDKYTIADDPALAPLRHAFSPQTPLTTSTLRQFGETFFTQKQLYRPQKLANNVGGKDYYWWLTEDKPGYVPSFAEARPEVEAAWRLAEARKLAEKEANAIAERVRKLSESETPDRFLRDEAAQHPGREVTEPLTPITKLVKSESLAFLGPTQYRPYQFKESDIALPRPNALDKLFDDLKKPRDAVVLADRPSQTFYVVALKARTEPTEEEFLRAYQHAPRSGFLPDTLWAHFQAQREEKYHTDLIKQFRAEAGASLDPQGNFLIDPDVRRRLTIGREGEE